MKDEIRAYIKTELLGDGSALADGDDLLSTGRVDSVGIMSLVVFIEAMFGVEVPPEDVTVENFLSLDAIEAYLAPRVA